MSKIDQILNKLADEHLDSRAELTSAKAGLLQPVLDVIGSDEPEDLEYEYYNKFHNNRNRLRAKQRKRAKELFGGDK